MDYQYSLIDIIRNNELQIQDIHQQVVGRTIKDALSNLITLNALAKIRIVEENGIGKTITCDYDGNRLNVAIQNETITKLKGIG